MSNLSDCVKVNNFLDGLKLFCILLKNRWGLDLITSLTGATKYAPSFKKRLA